MGLVLSPHAGLDEAFGEGAQVSTAEVQNEGPMAVQRSHHAKKTPILSCKMTKLALDPFLCKVMFGEDVFLNHDSTCVLPAHPSIRRELCLVLSRAQLRSQNEFKKCQGAGWFRNTRP